MLKSSAEKWWKRQSEARKQMFRKIYQGESIEEIFKGEMLP